MGYVPKSRRERVEDWARKGGLNPEKEEAESERKIEAKEAIESYIKRIEKKFKLTVKDIYTILQEVVEDFKPI